MKINKISDAVKILLIAGTIIVVCVIVALGFKMVNEGRSSIGNGVNQFNDMASEYSDVNLSNYDGSNVLGSEVTNFISKAIERKASYVINVKTKANINKAVDGKTYNSTPVETLTIESSHDDYINPNAQFLGKVDRNDNGIVTLITFTQTQ